MGALIWEPGARLEKLQHKCSPAVKEPADNAAQGALQQAASTRIGFAVLQEFRFGFGFEKAFASPDFQNAVGIPSRLLQPHPNKLPDLGQ